MRDLRERLFVAGIDHETHGCHCHGFAAGLRKRACRSHGYRRDSNPLADPAEETAEDEGNAGGMAAGKSGFTPPERAPMLYPLEDIVIPVIVDARVIKRIYVTARMAIAQGQRTPVEYGLPRMESAVNDRLVVYFQNHFAKRRRPAVRDIKRELVTAADQVYGDMINDFLLITVFEQ